MLQFVLFEMKYKDFCYTYVSNQVMDEILKVLWGDIRSFVMV